MPLDGNPAIYEETPADLLQRDAKAFFARVADLIEEKGWTMDVLQDRFGRVCLIGAIGLTLGCEVSKMPIYFKRRAGTQRLLRQAVKRLGFEDINHAMKWNDVIARNKVAVVDHLRDVR